MKPTSEPPLRGTLPDGAPQKTYLLYGAILASKMTPKNSKTSQFERKCFQHAPCSPQATSNFSLKSRITQSLQNVRPPFSPRDVWAGRVTPWRKNNIRIPFAFVVQVFRARKPFLLRAVKRICSVQSRAPETNT